MKIKNESNFIPPPEGQHNAVCVDVVDLGMIASQWGEQHKLRVVWELEAKMDNGKPFLASKRYTASIHPKSTLRKDLKTWRGRDFSEDEANEFDLEKVLGAPCVLVISHEEKDANVYANIDVVLKATTTKIKASGNYKRVKDREDYEPPKPKQGPATDHLGGPLNESEADRINREMILAGGDDIDMSKDEITF